MIPKIFVQDGVYSHFAAPFGLIRTNFPVDPPTIAVPGMEVADNSNFETILQVHRRKMLRRAANRRSAQLSRARKKAHLEVLKTENSRLQRLVDVLDSQPELIFCVTSQGRLTYISERTINFIKVNYSVEDSDDDPVHVNQILTKESVDSLLETITKLQKHTQVPAGDTDLNMLFAIKEVYFHDTFGHPVMGYLRCSKVHRRTSLHDLQSSDSIEKVCTSGMTSNSQKDQGPSLKKAKKSNSTSNNTSSTTTNGSANSINKSSSVSSSSNLTSTTDTPKEDHLAASVASASDGWNSMSNFRMLADYASSFTEDVKEDTESNNNNSSGNSSNKELPPSHSTSISSVAITDAANSPTNTDEEEEYVCVVRTTDNCFIQYRSHSDLLLFSSVVPVAKNSNDFDLTAQSETSSGKEKTATSSETGLDSNNSVDTDSH